MMRYFCKFIFVMLICCYSSTVCASDDIRAVTLTWVDDNKTTQAISWQTTEKDSNCYLEYGETDKLQGEILEPKIVKAETTEFVTNERNNFVNTVKLSNLKAGTKYSYRIGNGESWPKHGEFITGNNETNFKFLLFSDSQSYDYRVWQNTFEAAYLRNQQAKFYVVNGDLVDNGQKQQEWDAWFRAVSTYAGNISIVPVVGNHETYTPNGKFSLPKYFTEQFKVPQNGPAGLKGQVYSFDYGNVHFVVLDTQFGEERNFIPESLKLQQEWLAKDLATSDKQWKMVLMHRPIYHNRINEQGFDLTAKLAPVFDAYGVDLVFTGHDHVVAHTDKIKSGQVSTEGTIYAAVGRSGTKTYNTVGIKNWNVKFLNPVEQPVYNVVNINDNNIVVQVFKQDGELVDEWKLTK